jgi:anti-sigma factor (TIGR02949 family)
MARIDQLTCAQALARLDDFLDRELSPDEMRAVQAHLDVCARCAHAHRFEAGLLDELKQRLRRLSLPEALRARIREDLALLDGSTG